MSEAPNHAHAQDVSDDKLVSRAANVLRIFLADLHLDGTDTPRAKTFRNLMQRLGEQAAAEPVEVYLLGDLFELWEEYHPQVAALYENDLKAMEHAHRAGVKFFLVDGNRDFGYGRVIETRIGAELFHDGERVQLGDMRWVWLEHGDLLCTADVKYLKYRKWVRSWYVKLFYRCLPWSLAKKFVGNIKQRSAADKQTKAKEAFDVDEKAALERLEARDCRVLLCGHTHRPKIEELGHGRRLIVLPAWCEITSGYRERQGSLVPVHIGPDGVPQPAAYDGKPRAD